MAKELKNIRVFPYAVENPLDLDIKDFKTKFEFNNLPKNQVKYGQNYHLILITDKIEKSDFLCGRFFKLRRFIPSVVDVVNPKEKFINLLPSEEVKEQSHFIWNYNKNVILAEYNYDGIRHFSFPLGFYLNNIFSLIKKESENKDDPDNNIKRFYIDPKKNVNTLKLAKKESRVKSLFVRVADLKLSEYEKQYNADILKLLLASNSQKKGYIEIKIKSRRGKSLDKDSVIKQAENLKNKGLVESLIIEGEETKYDILNNNLLSSYLDITYDTEKRIIDKDEFYNQAVDYYNNNKELFE